MHEILTALYPWIKALHVISVLAWMAGLFYLPRLYVYHVETREKGAEFGALFEVMERRLLKAIMTPAMVSAWLFGLLLVATPGVVDWGASWAWAKAICVISMSAFHIWLARERLRLAEGSSRVTSRGWRMANEVPTLLMIVIVFAVFLRF